MQRFYRKLAAVIRSPYFFGVIVVLFLFEAAWIAVSARYPMAFDERYHLGIIALYSHQLSPLFTRQPPGPAPYGALTRDPSYLYHWLMSFPYRWFNDLGFKAQVISLRFINVSLFTASLVLFRRLLLKTKASAAIVHITLFFFILVPVVPQLAAQNNYDNLQILLLANVLLLLVRFRERLLNKKQFSIIGLLALLSLCLLGSLVKFTFLPFLAAVLMYVGWLLVSYARGLRQLKKLANKGWQQAATWQKWAAITALIVSTSLFIQMYGINVVKYHNLIPQCGQVLAVKQCLAYSPWARNYLDAQMKVSVNPSPIIYTGMWLGGMFERSFFAINGPGDTAGYQNHLLPIISITAAVVFSGGLLLLVKYHREVFRQDRVLVVLLFVSLVYIAALWGRNYHDYLQLGQPVALNGRYLVPVIVPIMLAMAMAYQQALARKRHLQALVALVVLAGFMQGGGTLSYIYASNDNWYWPGDKPVQAANHAAQKIIKPLTLGRL